MNAWHVIDALSIRLVVLGRAGPGDRPGDLHTFEDPEVKLLQKIENS